MAADSDMVCQTEEFAQIMAKNGNRVYRYFYNHQSSKGETKCFFREIDYMYTYLYIFTFFRQIDTFIDFNLFS